MIGRGLASGIGGAWIISAFLGKRSVIGQASKNLISGHMQEAEAVPAYAWQGVPVGPRTLQQDVGPDYIGIDKVGRSRNGTIDVRFSGKMNDGVRLMPSQYIGKTLALANVEMIEVVGGIISNLAQGLAVCRIRKLVDIYDGGICIFDKMATER